MKRLDPRGQTQPLTVSGDDAWVGSGMGMTSHSYTNDNIPCLSPIFVQAVERAINIKIKGSTYNLLARKYFCSLKTDTLGLSMCSFHQARWAAHYSGRVCHWTRCAGTRHPAPSEGDWVQTMPMVPAVLAAQCQAPESVCLRVSQQLLTHSQK